jgi:hypothetical protein
MRIKIQGIPEFIFSLTFEQVEALIVLSQSHYDDTCQAASRDRLAEDEPGFIFKWRACMRVAGEDYMHRARFRELDLCLKIMEMMRRPEHVTALEIVQNSFNKALTLANSKVESWQVTGEYNEAKHATL